MILTEPKEKVLITTSGIGSRLGDLTLFTNKSLIKLGDKAIISHIIDSYPNHKNFVITLGHYGSFVKQYLELAHSDKSFEFVDVSPYEGPGSGLVTSMLFAKDKLQCPFIFHACDTVLGNIQRPEFFSNYMACVPSSDSDSFRTVCINDGRVIRINDKGRLDYDLAYIGVAGIYEYKLFWEILERIKSYELKDSSDCHVLSGMLRQTDIKVWRVNEWYDTGSVNNLTSARKKFPQSYDVLDKSMESIYFLNNSVIKHFYDPIICKNRVERAKVLQGLVPEIEGHTENFYKYKRNNGKLLADVISEDKIIELVNYGEHFLWNPVKVNIDNFGFTFKDKCKVFYRDKTILRINEFRRHNNIEDKSEDINNTFTPTLDFMINNINWDWITDSEPTGFHGDFILDNILYNGEEKIILLDWRQDFAGLIDAGDKYYDLAKLNHNLILNHHILINKHFKISIDKDNIHCDVLRSQNMVNCQEIYHKLLESRGIDISKLKIITALIWLNMSPLHTYPLNNFLYYFGKYSLWRELKKRI